MKKKVKNNTVWIFFNLVASICDLFWGFFLFKFTKIIVNYFSLKFMNRQGGEAIE